MKRKQTKHLEFGETMIDGYKVTIERDDYPESPRDWDDVGRMVCWHRDYTLGDEQPSESPEEYRKYLDEIEKAGGVVLPLYLYDHSGVTMNVSGFNCPWDSGQVGWIYADSDTIKKRFGKARNRKERARKCLIGEVETYARYLEGEVYVVQVENPDGENIESCGRIYDDSPGFGYIWSDFVAPAIKRDKMERRAANKAKRERAAMLERGEVYAG